MSNKIRPGVEAYLCTYQIDIVTDWSDHEREVFVSRRDLAVKYSASVIEIGIFLKDVMGAQYDIVVRTKRQKFFSRVGLSRRNQIKAKREDVSNLTEELQAVMQRRYSSYRSKDDMSEEELSGISSRLLERIKDRPKPKKKYRKRALDLF